MSCITALVNQTMSSAMKTAGKESRKHSGKRLWNLQQAKKDTLVDCIASEQENLIKTTGRIFCTAYEEAKKYRPGHGFEQEIYWQQLNRLDMGHILHSSLTCSNVQCHIASEMRNRLLKIKSKHFD